MIWDINTALNALYGGLLIGAAISVLIIFSGKIAGISGILGQALSFDMKTQAWRYAFLLGLVISPIIYGFFLPMPAFKLSGNNFMIIVAGLLVGFGTRLGNGCTSGHGVCGVARFSLRSIVATVTFIVFGMLTVYCIRHLM